ncbi:MAG: NAD-dependent epimerase/dehydratase family protein [Clostridia bacterium]|nr:NAD-dependent epimerase/dehydratase family protein [Clostridia bacterium]
MKRVLVIGGTGTMGRYLCPILAGRGYEVDAIAGEIRKDQPGIRYHFANALDNTVLETYLKKGYDAVVDFMWYRDDLYRSRYKLFLEHTGHYFVLSSYRVYAESAAPLTEQSPRLAEALPADDVWKHSTGYAQIKCEMEDLLQQSDGNNWTILRPTVVYCPGRMPLVTWSNNEVALRAYAGREIVLPREAMDKKTTIVWAEDVARMIAGLMFKPETKKEIYNIATSETTTWGEILNCYGELFGLKAHLCDTDAYFKMICGGSTDQNVINQRRFLLYYDRLYDRSVDNSKVLEAAGLKQSDLMPIRKGLELSIGGIIPQSFADMDQFLGGINR